MIAKIEILFANLPSSAKALLLGPGLARWAVVAPEEMSIRTAAYRIVQHGRLVLRSFRNPENFSRGQLNKIHVAQVG